MIYRDITKIVLTEMQIITMAPRTQLQITTSSVVRLVKEEASYHKELEHQVERVKRVEAETAGDDENREYLLKQEVCAHHQLIFHLAPVLALTQTTRTWPLKRPRRSSLP